jgi:hypothetical protein
MREPVDVVLGPLLEEIGRRSAANIPHVRPKNSNQREIPFS